MSGRRSGRDDDATSPGSVRSSLPTKSCASCGRTMTWRKAWDRSWDEVRFCSDACRSRGVRQVDRDLEESILALLAERDRGKTICPSEAARAVYASASSAADDDGWRELMEPARAAARRLVAAERVEILQHSHPVDPSTARGPIRIRLR